MEYAKICETARLTFREQMSSAKFVEAMCQAPAEDSLGGVASRSSLFSQERLNLIVAFGRDAERCTARRVRSPETLGVDSVL